MEEENKNLESRKLKIRKILNWIFVGLGIIFIIIGILAPIALFIMAGGMGWWLPIIFGVLQDYTPAFIGLGIVLILIGEILKKSTLRKKIILIIFIILTLPFIFKATVGTAVGYNSTKENTITKDGETEFSEVRLKEITEKAVALEDTKECKKLLPLYFFPPFIASRLLPSFYNPYPITGIIKKSWSIGALYDIYSDGLTKCVTEVAKKKKDKNICKESLGPFIESGLPGYSLSYPFKKEECEYEFYYSAEVPVLREIIEEAKQANDPKICDRITDHPCWFNECIYRLADESKDIKLCERIRKEEKCTINYFETCYYTISPEFPPENMWKAYSVYGYEIKYPILWDVSRNSSSYCPGVSKSCITTSFNAYGGEQPKIYIYNPSPDAITIKKYNPFGSSAPNIFEIEQDMKLIKTEKEKIKDSEYYFEKFFYIPQERVEKERMILVKWVAGSFENSGAMVIYYKEEVDKNLQIFNQMLSTFRFLE